MGVGMGMRIEIPSLRNIHLPSAFSRHHAQGFFGGTVIESLTACRRAAAVIGAWMVGWEFTLMQGWESECWLDPAKAEWKGGRGSFDWIEKSNISISCFLKDIDPIFKIFKKI